MSSTSIYTASGSSNYVTLANSLSGTGLCDPGLLGTSLPFNGDIDDLRIYSRAMTAAEVNTLYHI
jgi:hypothetical protein